ncbi:hypothetical protein HOE04_02300 [archaeon]|jgi:hypothetical protein|nr:hypothetical protein [archaeon]
MNEEQIKLSFSKVKDDITNLYDEIIHLKLELNEIKITLNSLNNQLISHKNPNLIKNPYTTDNSTNNHLNQTLSVNKTDNQTVPQEIEGLKYSNLNSSTGNEGVSTDRQTDNKTDRQTQKIPEKSIESNIQEASDILDSLDRLKKEIRLKFKRVTTQEMAVFSTIYQLEEQEPSKTTYKQIAINLHLSESSIRDYVQRMINKGIPIKKQKINNRRIILSVSKELKKIATLSTIIQLRGL